MISPAIQQNMPGVATTEYMALRTGITFSLLLAAAPGAARDARRAFELVGNVVTNELWTLVTALVPRVDKQQLQIELW